MQGSVQLGGVHATGLAEALAHSLPRPPATDALGQVYVPPAARQRVSDVLDQADNGTFAPLSRAELKRARDNHARLTGVEPKQDEEPSAVQLAALRTRLTAGLAPHVDFAVLGPFEVRSAKLRSFRALVLVGGRFEYTRLQGPASYEAWLASWWFSGPL